MGVDGGYICPLYSIKEIGKRYGLTQTTQRYWKKHILPPPIDIIQRRGVRAHHWSKIQIIVLDDILRYLEKQGHMQLTTKYDDVIDLFHYGCKKVEKHFVEKYEERSLQRFDRHGVSFEI